MAAFNLTAELNLRGPSNLNQVVANIRRQLSTVTLDLNINPNTSRGIQAVTNNIRILSTALRDAQTNAAALSSTLSTLVTNINNVGNAANNVNSSFNNLNNQTRAAANGTRDAASEMEEFGRQSALAVRRFAAFSVATGAIYGLVRAISSAYSEFVNFNREFVRLQQVTNTSAAGLSSLSQEITRLSTGLGVSSKELLTVSTTLAQAGLSASQTKTALEALAKSALAPSFDNLNDTVEGSIALMRQFGLSAGDLESALGSINAVAAKFAVEAGDIITAIQRTGGVFAAASKGVSQGKDALNEFIAVFTSVRATTRESAETIATGLRTIFTRIQRGGTIQALKEFGIVLTDLQGKFVGPYEAVRRLSQGLQSLDPRDLRFSQIVEELGGFRQIGKVIPLIQQFATAQQALSVAQRGAGSLAADQAKAQEALAIRITKVREEFIALIRDIGQTQSFQKFVDISLKLASALISVASSAKEVLPALTAIAAIRAIPAIGQYARGVAGGLGRRRGFASGGLVPGSGNGDTVPAMLTPGEFVIRKKAVEKIGVNNLARMNTGGIVQKFADGSPGGVRKGIDWKNLSRGRGRRGARGARSRFDLPQPGDKDYLEWVRQIYAEYDADPSLPRVTVNGTPTPPEIAYAEKLITKEVFERGGSGMMLGYDAKGNEVIGKFGTSKTKKSGKLKKTPLGLLISAAGMQRGARAPAGEMEKILGAYEKDPEYRKAVGLTSSASVQQALSAFRKSGGQTSLAGVFSDSAISKIETGIPKYIETLGDEPQKIAKAKIAQQYLRSFTGGATANKAGHATAFSETINQMLKSGIIQEFAYGGLVQKFANGGQPLRQKMTREDRILQGMAGQDGIYKFGVAALRAGSGKKEDVSFSGASSRGEVSSKLLEQFTIPGNPPKKGQFYIGTLATKGLDDTIESVLKNSLSQSVSDAAAILASQAGTTPIKSTAALNRIYKGSGFQSIIGSSLEAAIASVGSPYIDKTEETKSFDFPLGLGPSASLFGIPANIPTDATRTIGGFGKGKKKLVEAATRFVQAVEGKEFTKARIEKIQSRSINKANVSSLLPEILSTIPPGLNASASGRVLRDKYGLARSGLTSRGIKASIEKAAKQGKDKEFLADLESEISKLQQPYATGGSVQDTVPALLTPGEFVVNKKAAQRIGYSKLNRLNKADKIQGFNKGGAVGDVQHFAGGGMVQSFFVGGAVQAATQIVRQLPQLATAIAQAVGALPRNIPQGGGWLASNRGTRAMGLPQSTGGALRNAAFDPMSIIFGSSVLGEGIGSLIGGRQGEAVSSAVSGGAGIGGVVASIVGVTTPFGALATAVSAAVGGIQAYNKSLRENSIAENNKLIEASGDAVDKALAKLAESSNGAANNLDEIKNNILSIIDREQQNISTKLVDSNPGFLSNIAERFLTGIFGNQDLTENRIGRINTSVTSAEILSQSRTGSETVTKTISELMKRGSTFGQAITQLSGGDRNKESQIRRSIAIGQDESAITDIEAKIKQQEENLLTAWDTTPIELSLKYLNQKLGIAIDNANKQYEKQQSELNKVNQASLQVTQSLRPFAQAMNDVAAASNRASAQFQEAQRQMDIDVGSAFGGQTSIASVSRANENVLSNLRAYSPGEISSTIDQAASVGRFDRSFTDRAKSAALSQRVLQTELPNILEKITSQNRDNTFGEDTNTTITRELERLLRTGGVNDDSAIRQIISEVTTALDNRGDKSIEEVLRSSGNLNKIMQNNATIVEQFGSVMKEQNDIIDAVRNRLNQYVGALEQAISGQIQATQIRLQAENQLADVLGQNLSIGERNQPFNREILDLTRNIGPGGTPVAGTGTLSPAEIAKRLDAADKRRRELEGTKGDQSAEQFAGELTQVTLQARQLETALKKLANDGTRAANALNQLQKLRQERFSRQNTFFDFASNANNPEFLTNFISDFASLTKIASGGGGLQDVQGAIRAFQLRANSGFIPSDQVEQERNQFGGMLAQRFGLPKELIDMMFRQTQAETDAIADFKAATEAQAQASELAATRTKDSAEGFYDKVLEAAQAFLDKVSGKTVEVKQSTQTAAAQNPARKSNGGLIYASKGQLVDFQPRGTDTVPAMLTPGEFVVNAKSTKKNLGLLQQINNSGKATGLSKGGIVYMAEGGVVGEQEKIERDRVALNARLNNLKSSQSSLGYYGMENKFIPGAGIRDVAQAEKQYKDLQVLIDQAQAQLNEFNSKYPVPPKPKDPPPPQPAVPQQLTPQQKAQQEKDRRKQAVLDEKERRKQAAMARNPGYAARVGREEAKKKQEQLEAAEFVKNKYGSAYDDPQQNLKEYRQYKREKRARMGADQARANEAAASKRQEQQESSAVPAEQNNESILSQAEIEAIERKNYGGLTKAEYDSKRKQEEAARQSRLAELEANRTARETPEAKRAEKEREERLARAEEERLAERQKWKRDIAEREAKDADSRSRGFKDSAQEAGVQARQKAEARAAEQRATDKQAQERKKAFKDKGIAEGENYGATFVAPFMIRELEANPKYENIRKDFGLYEYIKTRIQEKYAGLDLGDRGAIGPSSGGSLPRHRANLERIVSSATADYYSTKRNLKDKAREEKQAFANQNVQTGLQQFQERVDKSPIVAAGMAIPRAGYGVIRAGVGYSVAGAMALKNLNPANRPEDIAFNNEIINSAMAQGEAGLRIIESTGAGLGARLGFGEAYKTAEENANARINQINEQEANKARGLYTTDESTILGQLTKPEVLQRGATNLAQVTAEGAVDAFGGASSLVKSGEAAAAKGLTRAANAANRGIEGVGNKLVDIAEAGIESARTNAPLLPKLPQSPLPKIGQRITDALESRRVARETRRGQGALTREALAEAERKANLADAARRSDVINAELRARQQKVAEAVATGKETNKRMAGLEPVNLGDATPQNVTKTKIEEIKQSNKLSGSVSTPLDEPKASGRVTLETPETKPSVTRQDMETEALRRRMEGQSRSAQPRSVEQPTKTPILERDPTVKEVAVGSTGSMLIGGGIVGYTILERNNIAKRYASGEQVTIDEMELLRRMHPDMQLPYNTETGRKFNKGGVVYASKGTLIPYQPRGTDTVPAMLTPGEFVVNKRAAQQNMGLLKAINSNKVQKFSNGGQVKYFQNGSDGPVPPGSSGGGMSNLTLNSSEFTTAVNNFGTSVGSLSTAFGNFNNTATTLAGALGGLGTAAGSLSTAASVLSSSAQNLSSPIQEFKKSLDSIGSVLSKIPSEINFKVSGSIPVIVSVDVNGGEGLSDQLKPFGQQIFSTISEALRRATNGNLNIEISSELIG